MSFGRTNRSNRRLIQEVCLFILSCILLPPGALAQTDIPVSQIGPYVTIGRALNWGAAGVGGINNGFVFTPYLPDTGICVEIFNNSVTSNTFTFTSYVAVDPMLVGIYSNPAAWSMVNSASLFILGNSPLFVFVKSAGAAKVELVISGSAVIAGGTVDLVVAQSQSGCAALGGGTANLRSTTIPNTGSTVNAGSTAGIFCDQTFVFTVATGATVVVNAGAAGLNVHVCAYTISGPTQTTSAALTFESGTAATCATLGPTLWQVTAAAGIPNYALSASPGQLFQTGLAINGLALCFTNTGTGSPVTLDVTYAVF